MLSEAYLHCGQIAREHRRDFWLGALFAPENARPHLHAMQAFAYELSRIQSAVREPLMGEIRLTWWQEALAGEREAEAASHPVAAAFVDTLRACGIAPGELEAIFRARRDELYRDREPSTQERALALGPVYALGARILGAADGPPLAVATQSAGEAEAWLGSADGADEGLRRLDAAEAALRNLPASLAPAFAALAAVRLDLKRRASGRGPAPAWRRQLVIWLWMRRW